MTQNNHSEQIQSISVGKLLSQDQYIVPIYQRNYSWTVKEIEQLIEDVKDACDAKRDNYYIGSLVVDKKDNGEYEVIDGQQRLTTLTLLYSALRHNEQLQDTDISHTLNLKFAHRDNNVLKFIFENGLNNKKALEQQEIQPNGLTNGYFAIQSALSKEYETGKINLKEFYEFLRDKVVIYRTEVPPNTDLNHYFEIMNNRGEQLEKHEILKARMMSHLDDEKSAFNTIWTACSEMGRYVVMGIKPEFRKEIFGTEKLDLFKWNGQYFSDADFSESLSAEKTIFDILSTTKSQENNQTDEEKIDRFESIVSFPNFLMIALKIYVQETNTQNGKSVSLDEQFLIREYEEYFFKNKENLKSEVLNFAEFLLKLRMLFDNYIIKRDGISEKTEEWSLKTAKYDSKEKSVQYVNTFEQNSNISQEHCVMLLSMFHVSFPSTKYKQWLYEVMNGLYNKSWIKNYQDKLILMAKDYYESRRGENDKNLDLGTDVANYLFNYLDYKLWLASLGLTKEQFKDKFFKPKTPFCKQFDDLYNLFGNFYFAFRSSVEHCFPQSRKYELISAKNKQGEILVKDEKEANNLNNQFGNLCLIHSSMNSSLSDNSIQFKRSKVLEYAKFSKSLKQILMLMYDDKCWNPQKSENLRSIYRVINEHQEKMLEILNS